MRGQQRQEAACIQALTVKSIRLTCVALILDLAAGGKIFRKFWRHPCSSVTHFTTKTLFRDIDAQAQAFMREKATL